MGLEFVPCCCGQYLTYNRTRAVTQFVNTKNRSTFVTYAINQSHVVSIMTSVVHIFVFPCPWQCNTLLSLRSDMTSLLIGIVEMAYIKSIPGEYTTNLIRTYGELFIVTHWDGSNQRCHQWRRSEGGWALKLRLKVFTKLHDSSC